MHFHQSGSKWVCELDLRKQPTFLTQNLHLADVLEKFGSPQQALTSATTFKASDSSQTTHMKVPVF